MSFHVGQKVVCVDDSDTHDQPEIKELTKGKVYCVRWIGLDEDTVCVRLQEVKHRVWLIHGKLVYRGDRPFAARRFRPLIERKTDTGFAILQNILNRESFPQPEKVVEHRDGRERIADGTGPR